MWYYNKVPRPGRGMMYRTDPPRQPQEHYGKIIICDIMIRCLIYYDVLFSLTPLIQGTLR